ncbi:agmatine deiminase [Cellvibrio zantedeschiae]|uniref:Agmatine deiminase n=1 Tax=Cellvibrio zantedeschiae TaxID=1237077 RepID=A0ABQ3B153_9GAMM|nr:agmatine deiminase family protein [Cellvibrio zantedeschiae]GGY70460.1 agmatine deiminase [Cellvibrio zantedeschiae]
MTNRRLPAEWEPQDAILLAWPHKDTGWSGQLDELTQLYEALVSVICDFADLVIAIPEGEIEDVRARLAAMDVPLEYVYFYPVVSNDTWARDFGPVTVQTEEGMKLIDFGFNAWGGKYPFDLDSKITQRLRELGAFPSAQYEALDFILEGGSIESDGKGTLLTTTSCLLNKNRNPGLSKEQIEEQLKNTLGIKKINWISSGYLAGDDTDGHVDVLARFCPQDTIVYTACDDEQDEHYAALKQMEAELKAMTNAEGQSYRLLALPWPGAKFNDSDERVPATYANFLIVNEAVLVPIYDSLSDEDALDVISQAFPGYEIFGIPCSSLIERGGSLHCITMQLPEGVLLQA